MYLQNVLEMATKFGAAVHVHVHVGSAGKPSSVLPTTPTQTGTLAATRTKVVLDALAGNEPVKKEAIIRAVFGSNFTESQGRTVTRILATLLAEGRVTQPKYGMWQLS